jgi:ABC-type nitrate/sulfonate/bicarbonate transport system substrate-binding protein
MKMPVLSTALLGLFLILSVLSSHIVWADDDSVTSKTLTLGLAKGLGHFPLLISHEKQLKPGGLSLETRYYASGKKVLHAILTGEVDMGVVGLGPLVFAGMEKKPFRILASVARFSGLYKIVARKDRGIQKPADLRGKRVGVTRASSMHYFLHNFLVRSSVSEKDLAFSFKGGVASLPERLAQGEVDAIVVRRPYVASTLSKLGEAAVVFTDDDLPSNTLNVVASVRALREKGVALQAFINELLEVEKRFLKNPEAADPLLFPEEAFTSRNAFDQLHAVDHKVVLEQSLIIQLENIARWAASNRFTEAAQVPNFLTFIADGSLKKANPEAVTLFRRTSP